MKQWFIYTASFWVTNSIKKHVLVTLKPYIGVIHYNLLTTVYLLFFNGFVSLSILNQKQLHSQLVYGGIMGGTLSGISTLLYNHQKETSWLSLFNLNIIGVMILDTFLMNNHNVMSIGGTIIIIIGVVLIDFINLTKGFKNMDYWSSIDNRILQQNDIEHMYDNNLEESLLTIPERTFTKQHIAVVAIILQVMADIITKYSVVLDTNGEFTNNLTINHMVSIHSENSTAHILLFSPVYGKLYSIIYYFNTFLLFRTLIFVGFLRYIKQPILLKIDEIVESKILIRNLIIDTHLGVFGWYIYAYVLTNASNIGYGKSTMITYKVFVELSTLDNLTDIKIIGVLFIICGSVIMMPNFILF